MNTFMTALSNKRDKSFENIVLGIILALTFAGSLVYIAQNWAYVDPFKTALTILIGIAVLISMIGVLCPSCNGYDDSYIKQNKTLFNIVVFLVRLTIKTNAIFIFIGVLLLPVFFYFAKFYILVTVILPNIALGILLLLFVVPMLILSIVRTIVSF